MKRIMLVATALFGLSAQASFAQGSNQQTGDVDCERCERLILQRLTQIAVNTEATKGDSAALRMELMALRRDVAELRTALANRMRTPLYVHGANLIDQAGDVNQFCATIGYTNGWSVTPPRPGGPGNVATGVICYDRRQP